MVDFEKERFNMVEYQIKGRGIKDQRVIEAMKKVPRHLFVPESLISIAYGDHPVSIGEGQTISQPYIVALMTEALNLKSDEKVLEIGTGSGYQTAILAELCKEVYTVERIPSLSKRAMRVLEELGYKNIKFGIGDGSIGWKEYAPYDGIIVTAGAPHFPQPLLEQLSDGGRLVIPCGDEYSQSLYKVTRRGNKFEEENLGGCRFVKLLGAYGWKE
jgi:protein-L-isoaspartate(D-aspartate) O-methyltransferase